MSSLDLSSDHGTWTYPPCARLVQAAKDHYRVAFLREQDGVLLTGTASAVLGPSGSTVTTGIPSVNAYLQVDLDGGERTSLRFADILTMFDRKIFVAKANTHEPRV